MSKPTLVIITSDTCPHCTILLDRTLPGLAKSCIKGKYLEAIEVITVYPPGGNLPDLRAIPGVRFRYLEMPFDLRIIFETQMVPTILLVNSEQYLFHPHLTPATNFIQFGSSEFGKIATEPFAAPADEVTLLTWIQTARRHYRRELGALYDEIAWID